jgi:hypothetical protein
VSKRLRLRGPVQFPGSLHLPRPQRHLLLTCATSEHLKRYPETKARPASRRLVPTDSERSSSLCQATHHDENPRSPTDPSPPVYPVLSPVVPTRPAPPTPARLVCPQPSHQCAVSSPEDDLCLTHAPSISWQGFNSTLSSPHAHTERPPNLPAQSLTQSVSKESTSDAP